MTKKERAERELNLLRLQVWSSVLEKYTCLINSGERGLVVGTPMNEVLLKIFKLAEKI